MALHTIDLDPEIIAKVLRQLPRLIRWPGFEGRLLLFDSDDPLAGVEVTLAGANGLQLYRGPYPAAMVHAIERAEQRPELDGAEVRLLRVSALHFRALWLHGGAGREDLLIPLRPAPPPVVANRDYAPAELLDLLAEMARENLTTQVDDEVGA
jgi:hypothetical protein